MKWHLETHPIKSLKQHPKNPRILTRDQLFHLERSLDKFGLIDKPIINTDKTVIGGHQRIRTLQKMGAKDVECWVPDEQLDDKDVEELNIRLNKNVGEWDWDTLANVWDADELIKYGFTEEELLDEKVVSKKKRMRIVLEFETNENMQDCVDSAELEAITRKYEPQVKLKK